MEETGVEETGVEVGASDLSMPYQSCLLSISHVSYP